MVDAKQARWMVLMLTVAALALAGCVDMEPHGGTGTWCVLDEDAELLQQE